MDNTTGETPEIIEDTNTKTQADGVTEVLVANTDIEEKVKKVASTSSVRNASKHTIKSEHIEVQATGDETGSTKAIKEEAVVDVGKTDEIKETTEADDADDNKSDNKSIRTEFDEEIEATEGDENGQDNQDKKEKKKKFNYKEAVKKRFTFGGRKKRSIERKDVQSDEGEEGEEEEIRQSLLNIEGQIPERHTKVLEEEYDEILAKEVAGQSEDSDTISVDSGSSTDLDTVNLKTEFLNTFEELPDLSDISEEEEQSEVIASIKVITSIQSRELDKGVFVDPLTGEILSSSSTVEPEPEPEPEEIVTTDEPESTSDLSFGDELFADDVVEEIQLIDEEYNVIETMQKAMSTIFIVEDEDEEYLHRQKFRRELREITFGFLFDLFNEVVELAEYIDPNTVLAGKLDKAKLLSNINFLTVRYQIEKQVNTTLLGKVADYYKRMKNMRSFIKLSNENEIKEFHRYHEALQSFDHGKKVAAAAKKQNAYLMSSVLMDLQHMQNISSVTETELENTMCNHLVRDSEHMKRILERELRLMRTTRNEISDTRLFLITRKHTQARLVERIAKFEQITEDLCMTHFISIQNEVQALDKKIEERNAELNKLRGNYHNELHEMAHNRERALAASDKLNMCKKVLHEKQVEQYEARDAIFRLKLQRARLRKEHNELVFSGGLLANPMLMYDFDATVEKSEVKIKNIKKLKLQMADLEKRIAMLALKLTRISTRPGSRQL